MHRAVDLFEIPGVFQLHRVEANIGLRRDSGDIAAQLPAERSGALSVDQLQPVDEEILVLAECDGRPPAPPPVVLHSDVKRGADKADYDAFANHSAYPDL